MKTRFFPLLTPLVLVGGLLVFPGSGCTSKNPPPNPGGLQIGDKAADFSLMDETAHTMRLSDVQPGWYLVLIFYRGSWCNACVNQLLNLKEKFPQFTALHAALAAVSVDSLEDSANFNQQWRFPFPLLSDPDLQLIDAYGVRHAGGHAGKDIARPTVVVIDPGRTVRYKYIGKSPLDIPSDEEILFEIRQLEQPPSPTAKS